MKIDLCKHKEKYMNWKEKTNLCIPNINRSNSDLIKQYLNDMEKGINVSSASVKGSRSFNRLNTLRDKMVFFARNFEKRYNITKITDITEEQLISFFSDMKNGVIKKANGENYQSVDSYTRIFKAFWHWHMKTNKKNGSEIKDITEDLDTKQEKPKWVYLNEEQIKRLCNNAKYEYKVLIMFLFDSGIRSPTELINVKVSDLFNDCKELNIREEIVKKGSFGRRIKLMFCSELLKEYIRDKGLKQEDYLFKINPVIVNKYLKRLAVRVLGDGISQAGAKYSEISLYDFRHISCCYWLLRYKSESALKYRFGWKKSDKIHYYSELIGMKDTISEEDLFVDLTKTDIEKRLMKAEQERELFKEKLRIMEKQMEQISELTNKLYEKFDEIIETK